MAEITKITTPLLPKENLGNKRPVSEQAFEINNPTRVNKMVQDRNVQDRDAGEQALREALGRTAVTPLLRGTNDVIMQFQKMVAMLEMGISTSDIVASDPMRELVRTMFVPSDKLLGILMQQDETGVIFKGEAFDVMRDILDRFPDNAPVKDALTNLLKTFEYNVNLDNSIKTILYQCENLLDYMFTKDRTQFGEYLDNLADMLMPEHAPSPEELVKSGLFNQKGESILPEGTPLRNPDGTPARNPVTGQPFTEKEIALLESTKRATGLPMYSGNRLEAPPAEAAAVLKNNLLPLLGEVVVKYYQSESIRDLVMVVVHNIVRVDKGTPAALEDAVNRLVDSLSRVANVGEGFAANLREALTRASTKAKFAENEVITKLSSVVSQTLRSPEASPVALRQAENLLLSLLQNQSSMMNIQHFIMPLMLPDGNVYSEMYVDPDSQERPKGGGGENETARKVFLSISSEQTGAMEIQFLECGYRVDFNMWCADNLVEPLRRIKRPLADLMLVHGYTLTGFGVDELVNHHSIIQVFPRLLDRKVGIDVRI